MDLLWQSQHVGGVNGDSRLGCIGVVARSGCFGISGTRAVVDSGPLVCENAMSEG